MAPQDDLTAERAADLYSSIRASTDGFDDDQATDDLCVEMLRQALKAARQEALREAASVVNDYNCRHDHGKKATKACDDIFDELDRLASEGG